MESFKPSADLVRIASIVGEWANEHPFVIEVYIFGSYVRGDSHPGSDLDMAVLYDVDNNEAFGAYMSIHDERTIRDLERRVGIKLQVSEANSRFQPIRNEPDIILPMLRDRREHPSYVVGKVRCIGLPAKAGHQSRGRM